MPDSDLKGKAFVEAVESELDANADGEASTTFSDLATETEDARADHRISEEAAKDLQEKIREQEDDELFAGSARAVGRDVRNQYDGDVPDLEPE